MILLILLALSVQTFSQSNRVEYTLEDRDRLIRTEEKVEALRSEMNIKFESSQGEINSLRNEMNTKFEAIESKIETLYWGFGILIALMLFLFGYIVWDRRTALNPVQNKTMDLETRLARLEFITKQQAKKDPAFAEILKHAGLL
ncbi:MAG: hypothetical protein ACLFPE_13810 [Bacteroidales bacterium]